MKAKGFLLLISCFLQASILAQTSNLSIGQRAIPFEGTDQNGKKISLSSQLAHGKVVLFFYRGYWCPFCNKQLSEWQDSLSYFQQKNASLLAVTPEAPAFIKKSIEKTSAKFPIIHDKNYEIMKNYGVAFSLNELAVMRMKNVGIDLVKVNDNVKTQLPVPAVFIINQQGIIEYLYFDPDYTKRPSVKRNSGSSLILKFCETDFWFATLSFLKQVF